MRNINCNVLSIPDNTSDSGIAIDTNQIIAASFHAFFGDTQAAGSIHIDVSNDIYNARYNYPEGNFVPTNWTTLSTTSVASGTSKLITINPTSYRWMRASWISTGIGAQTITTIADQSALAQTERVTCVDDVDGSLNSTYFLLYSAQNAATYYVWYNVDGAGIDPMIVGAIGIEVDIATNELADDIATISTGPIAAISGAVIFNANSSTDNLLIYNLQTGPSTIPGDGISDPTGFSFAIASPGRNSLGSHLNNDYFFLNASDADGGTAYYVWFNVASGGTDPMLPGKTGIEVDIAAGATSDDVATAVAAAIDASPDFASTAAGHVATVTNTGAGPFIPASDFDTTFTFAITGGGSSTITVNMNALSM